MLGFGCTYLQKQVLHCLVVVSRLSSGIADKRDVGCELILKRLFLIHKRHVFQCITRSSSRHVRANIKVKVLQVSCWSTPSIACISWKPLGRL